MVFRSNMKNKLPVSVVYGTQLVIRIPHARVLKLIARSVFLAFVIISLPWIGSFIRTSQDSNEAFVISNVNANGTPVHSILLPLLFQDLINEGLFKLGGNAVFVNTGDYNVDVSDRQILSHNQIELVSEMNQERQRLILDNGLDFVISSGFRVTEFMDRSLKIGGIAVVRLSNDSVNAFERPSNYKIVYLRRFDSTVVGMRKLTHQMKSPAKRRLFAYESEAKRAALNGLEDVILEPPRGSSNVFKNYLRKTKYLPELTGDSLDGYPRRVFIDVALPGKSGSGGSIEWFKKNYPTRNRVFDIYNIEMDIEDAAEESEDVPQVGVSEWLRKNVKEEEYVVMKAEADTVEEMISSKAIDLVDELFLECKHQWQRGKKNKGRRAYWECVALYGRLRDEGVAVHQWWE